MKIHNEGTEYESTEWEFSDLVGRTISAITVDVDGSRIVFDTDDGRFLLYHYQCCCESVYVESITGDTNDLIGTPVLVAEERTSPNAPMGVIPESRDESETWTFYTIRTIKGTVDIRWYGSSNGYYSESVDFSRM